MAKQDDREFQALVAALEKQLVKERWLKMIDPPAIRALCVQVISEVISSPKLSKRNLAAARKMLTRIAAFADDAPAARAKEILAKMPPQTP